MGDRYAQDDGASAHYYRDSRGYAFEIPPERGHERRPHGRPPSHNKNNHRDNHSKRDDRRHRSDDMDGHYGPSNRRYSEDYGRRDSDRRIPSRESSRSSREDYYGPGRRGSDRGIHDEDWICPKCSCKNRPYERRCYDCGKRRNDSPPSSEDEFGRPRKKNERNTTRQWPPVFEGNADKFVLDSRSGMFYDATSDFFYDPASKLYYGNKKKAYFSYNVSTKKFLPVNSTEGEVQPTAPRGSSGDADVADADQMMIMPHGADAVKKDVAVAPKIAINIKTTAKPDKKRKKRSESNADAAKKEKQSAAAGAPPTKVAKKHAENIEKWQERQREMNPESLPRVTNQGKPICWVCRRKFPTEEKLKLHEAKSQLHKDNLEKEKNKKQEPKPVVESGAYVDRAKQRRDLYGPDLVAPTTAPQVTPLSEPLEGGADRPMENPATNIGHQMMEKMGWKAGGTIGRGSEEQQQQQAALAKDWDRIEGIAAQNRSAPARRPR